MTRSLQILTMFQMNLYFNLNYNRLRSYTYEINHFKNSSLATRAQKYIICSMWIKNDINGQ